MRRLWTRLSSAYGAKRWADQYGDTPPAEWEQALGAFTLNDLARGIMRAERDDSRMVPNLGMFVSWCREFQRGTFAGNAAPLPGVSALLDAPATEASEKYRAMCRRVARGEHLTRAELKSLPPVYVNGGHGLIPIRPFDYCKAAEDFEA